MDEVVGVARLNFLDRFRPVGAPGAAGSSGRVQEVRGPAAELAPVFAALAPDLQTARELVEEAERSAEAALADARVRASAITAQARLDAVPARSRAATEVKKKSTEQDRRLLARAHKKASTLETSAAVEVTAVAQRVVERMVTDLLATGDPNGVQKRGTAQRAVGARAVRKGRS